MNPQPEMSQLKKAVILGLTILFAIPTALLLGYVAYQIAAPVGLGGWAAMLVGFFTLVLPMVNCVRWTNPPYR